MDTIYVALGIVLILSVIVLTIVIARFFEHYRRTLKQADFTIRTAEQSLHDVDKIIDIFTTRISDVETFLTELNKSGQNLERINETFTNISDFFQKFPSGIASSIFLLNQLDVLKGLGRLFHLNNKDEELDSMLRDFLKGAIVGGLAVAFLTPRTGEEMRVYASEKLDELKEKAKDIDVDDVRQAIFDKIDEIKAFLKDANKDEIVDRVFSEIKRLYEKVLGYLPNKSEPTTEVIEKQ